MSGGSLNYLCYKEPVEMLEHFEDLESVEETLIDLGANDVALDVRRLIEYCKSAIIRISVLQDNLNDIFHAVEWYRSADYGRDTVLEAIEKYRTGVEQK